MVIYSHRCTNAHKCQILWSLTGSLGSCAILWVPKRLLYLVLFTWPKFLVQHGYPHDLVHTHAAGSGTFGTVLGGTFYGASVVSWPNSESNFLGNRLEVFCFVIHWWNMVDAPQQIHHIPTKRWDDLFAEPWIPWPWSWWMIFLGWPLKMISDR